MRKLVLRKEEEARDSSSLGCHHVRLGPRVRRVASGTTRFADVAQLARPVDSDRSTRFLKFEKLLLFVCV